MWIGPLFFSEFASLRFCIEQCHIRESALCFWECSHHSAIGANSQSVVRKVVKDVGMKFDNAEALFLLVQPRKL